MCSQVKKRTTGHRSVSAVVVTYNRKEELARCIKAVLGQTFPVSDLLIVDNASTDGTTGYLIEKKLLKPDFPEDQKAGVLLDGGTLESVRIHYYRMHSNTGGSGGFHKGLQLAHVQLHTDFYWLMDDDGYPSADCLRMLMKGSRRYDYIMPASIDIADHTKLSWPVRMRNGKKTDSWKELRDSWGRIMHYVTPFNGILLSENCVSKVGYINPDFFLWGDEYDHYYRCLEQGFHPVTLMDAVFYHPSQKLPLIPICSGLFHVPYVDSKLRMVCLARNYTYVYRRYHQKYKIPLKFLQYTWLFLITRRGDLEGWKLYIASVGDGFREDFTRHLNYLDP